VDMVDFPPVALGPPERAMWDTARMCKEGFARCSTRFRLAYRRQEDVEHVAEPDVIVIMSERYAELSEVKGAREAYC